jgi:hypothetical protein
MKSWSTQLSDEKLPWPFFLHPKRMASIAVQDGAKQVDEGKWTKESGEKDLYEIEHIEKPIRKTPYFGNARYRERGPCGH